MRHLAVCLLTAQLNVTVLRCYGVTAFCLFVLLVRYNCCVATVAWKLCKFLRKKRATLEKSLIFA